MELRRALLLFAIVLGLAAIATAVSRPEGEEQAETPAVAPARPQAGPGPGSPAPARLSLTAGGHRENVTLEAGRPGTLVVEADGAGTIEIPSLGLSAPVARLTAARFDLFHREPRAHEIRFTPAGDTESRQVGTLRIKAEQPG